MRPREHEMSVLASSGTPGDGAAVAAASGIVSPVDGLSSCGIHRPALSRTVAHLVARRAGGCKFRDGNVPAYHWPRIPALMPPPMRSLPQRKSALTKPDR